MRKTIALLALAAAAATLGACSLLDLGPEPSNSIGPALSTGRPLTDADLQAVTPAADDAAATRPATTIPGPATLPGTMPAATSPALPALAQGTSSQPALGKLPVPPDVDLQDAILLGLQNNTSLRVDRYNVPISRTAEETQRAAFDPTVSGTVSGGRSASHAGNTSKGPTTYTDTINAQLKAQEFLPTGTTLSAEFDQGNSFYSDASSSSGVSATVTQSLLRGAGLAVNLASLRQSQLDTKITQYQLRGFAEATVDSIEETYWDLAYAERQVVIVQNALNLALEQLKSTKATIAVGRLAATEQAAADAEVALQRENLINAKSTLDTTRIKFLQLITPAGEPFWNRTIALQTPPFIPTGDMDPVEKHVAVALEMRPEINQTKLQIERGDLDIVKTKNGLLPQLDLFITLGQTGYASSFGPSFTSMFDGPDYNALVGVKGSYPIENRAARAAYHAAVLTREQTDESLRNLVQTVQIDVAHPVH